MDIETLRAMLGWCALMGMGMLCFWFGWIVFAREWVYSLHRRWFPLEDRQLDAIHYGGMGLLKLTTLMLFALPWVALHIVA